MGLVLARTNRHDEALQEFRQAGCSEANSHVNLAYALTLNGDWSDATRHYEKALAMQPDLPAAQSGLEKVTVLMARQSDDASKQIVQTSAESVKGEPAQNIPTPACPSVPCANGNMKHPTPVTPYYGTPVEFKAESNRPKAESNEPVNFKQVKE